MIRRLLLGSFSGMFVLSCSEPTAPNEPASLEISATSLSFASFTEATPVVATVKTSKGAVMTGAPVQWTTSTSSIATVSAVGLVTAVGNGSATITASASPTVSAAVTVTVSQVGVTLTVAQPTVSVPALTDTVTVGAALRDARLQLVTNDTVEWRSSDTTVAVVDIAGRVTSRKNGTATITASAGTLTATARLTVEQVATGVVVSQPGVLIEALTDTVRVTAQVVDRRSQALASILPAWSTENSSVATVSAAGLVTGMGTGTTTLRATHASFSTPVTIVVVQRPVAIELSTATLSFASLTDTGTVRAIVRDSRGIAIPSSVLLWSSSDTTKVRVNTSGRATSVANGTATITAAVGTLSRPVGVTVAQVAASLTASHDSVWLQSLPDTTAVSATVRDARGVAMPQATVTWASANPVIASVTSSGAVIAATNGTTRVTASAGAGADTLPVRVQQVARTIQMNHLTYTLLVVGDSVALGGGLTDARGTPIAGRTPQWIVTDTAVVSVSASGVVRAKGHGGSSVTAVADSARISSYIRVGVRLQLVEGTTIHEFLETNRAPSYEYAGVTYPGALVSWMPFVDRPVDLWADGQPDIIAPFARGYATGLSTRVKPFFFRNENGTFVHATSSVSVPAIAGFRRMGELSLPNDPFRGIFGVNHDGHDGTMADALMLSAGAMPMDVTSRIDPLPLAPFFGRPNAVNAHSMASGDINGDGRTDFVVGDWAWRPDCPTCGPYFLMQGTDGRWNVRPDTALFNLTYKEPMVNAGAGEGQNLLIDIHLDDFNGDGKDDIVAGYGHGSTYSRIYLNDGNANFSRANSKPLPAPPYGFNNSMHLKTYSPDINGDGLPDLIISWSRYVPYYGGTDLQILINKGNGDFVDETPLRLRSLPGNELPVERLAWTDWFQLIDVNNDGQLDIIGSWYHHPTSRVRVGMNAGGTFSEIEVQVPSGYRGIPLGWVRRPDGRLSALVFQSSWTSAEGIASRNWFYHLTFDRVIR